jgi:hypothetical protein
MQRGRNVQAVSDWPEPANEAQRQALEQYKFLRKELEDKLGGWKLGSLSARMPEELQAYAKLLRSKVERLTANANEALAAALRDQEIAPLAEALEQRRPDRFADLAMTIVDPPQLLDAFARALDILDEQNAHEADAQGLHGAAHVIAPWIANQSDAVRVRRALDGATVDVIEARVGSGTMAEVLMAAAERKATEFRPRRKRGDPALGRRAVNLGAEAGPEDGEARDVAALILELQEMKGVAIDVSRVNGRVKQVLEGDYGVPLSDQKVRIHVAREKDQKRRRYYLLADKPRSPPAQEYLRAVLRQVCDATPGLVAIVIDSTLDDEEYALLQSVLEIIELEGGKGKNAKD